MRGYKEITLNSFSEEKAIEQAENQAKTQLLKAIHSPLI
jgi:hypothetical protein